MTAATFPVLAVLLASAAPLRAQCHRDVLHDPTGNIGQFGPEIAADNDRALVRVLRFASELTSVVAAYEGAGRWTQPVQYLEDPESAMGGPPSAYFGFSIAMSGERAIIGAPSIDGSGSAWIFARQDGRWEPEVELVGSGGVNVAISGSVAAVVRVDSVSPLTHSVLIWSAHPIPASSPE